MVKRRRWPGLQILNIHMGLFDYTVKVVIGAQAPAIKFIRWYVRDLKVELSPDMRGCFFHRDPFCPIVWIPRRPRTAREHGTLTHEAMHAVSQMARWCAIGHAEATEEVFCHALGHLVTGVLAVAK